MTTTELFARISATKEFKEYPNSRVIRHRHNKGTLTNDTYQPLFASFGYIQPDNWIKKK